MAQMVQLNLDLERAYEDLRKENDFTQKTSDPTKSFRREVVDLRNHLTETI